MSSPRKSSFFRSFAFYLGSGYLIIYLFFTILSYFSLRWMITESNRRFDLQDISAECEELVELLNQNSSGNMLAEAVTMERYPPSTLFILRIVDRFGRVEYTMTWPKKIDVPEWGVDRLGIARKIPETGIEKYYLPSFDRSIQVQTVRAHDGRFLQVGKSSFLESDQKSMLSKMLIIFALLSTAVSALTGLFMMVITLRPIHHITASMSRIIDTGAFEDGATPVKSMISELDTLGSLFTIMTKKYAKLIRALRETMDHVAHDFRTPLARIRGSAELALGRYDQLPADICDSLADIIEDCDRAKLQLQNLMDTREMECGFVKLDIKPFDLRSLVEEMMDVYSMVAEEKGVHFLLQYPGERVCVEGDRIRLARAIGNLVDNAIKYTHRGGSVTLGVSRSAGEVRISISDTGIGIPEEEQVLVWQRLFRGKTAQEAEKGLGLGLNIVRVIVESHQGRITLESRVGEGSTFTVILPASDESIPPPAGEFPEAGGIGC